MLQKLNRSRRGGFTLVEIMIVVAIIGLLAAVAVPNFLRARLRSQATRILEDLRQVDGAIQQAVLEKNLPATELLDWDLHVVPYLKAGTALSLSDNHDLFGNSILVTGQTVSDPISVHMLTVEALEEVADAAFWGQFYGGPPTGP